jgi:hypothetical protein
MKKLGKLNINPEKIISNEELIILKGGSGIWNYSWDCYDDITYWGCVSTVLNIEEAALAFCNQYRGPCDYVDGPYEDKESCHQY